MIPALLLGPQPEVPVKATADAQREMKRLKAMKNAAFDREFIKHMVKDHKKDIREFQQFSNSATGPAADVAKKQLPVLQKHLQTAQQLGSSPGEGSAIGAKGSKRGKAGGAGYGAASGTSGSGAANGAPGSSDNGAGGSASDMPQMQKSPGQPAEPKM